MERLRNVTDFPALVDYLRDELDWPIDAEDAEEIVFEYDADELGIDPKYAVKINSIRQIRPLTDDQPWGVFFIEFEGKRLPVVVLRRILRAFASTTRNRDAYRPVWELEDLLFVSAFGEDTPEQREIAFAHFHQEGNELPTLRVLGWDGSDTPLKLEFVDGVLRTKLRWPNDETDHDAWRTEWSTAFRNKPRHVIRTADALADELAALARRIRDAALVLLDHETEDGPLRSLHKAFQTALIHDLSEADFADTYAQTITYGLLTAAISRTDMTEGRYGTALVAENVADMVPVTNPFLREMLEEFMSAGGRQDGIDFDELGVQDVVELLRGEETDLPAILRDFGNKTQGEDPVIHFYENFLAAYDRELKVQRGVFYTPKPVVSYIVRSVHELLQTEFGLEDGLADTTTWGEMVARDPTIPLPADTDPDSPFVVILDPAAGTATFLVETIDVIHRTLKAKWRKSGMSTAQQQEAWNNYVPEQLLPRIYGYELMMAPYAIAHMKVGLKLQETGYRFGSSERVQVYLTNALESAKDQHALAGILPALSHEAAEVSEVKRTQRFTVIIANPPYSIRSSNLSDDARQLIAPFKFVNGRRLVEKGALQLEKNLNDDYVKFFGLILKMLSSQSEGVVGLITNHTYLDNPTLRGLRWNLLSQFTTIRILDLHGNSKRNELVPNGKANENVFDIQQGVAISLMSRRVGELSSAKVLLAENWGTREQKYRALDSTRFEYEPIDCPEPWYKFAVLDGALYAEFDSYIPLTEIMPLTSTGIKTHRDAFVIDFEEERLLERVSEFRSNISDADIAEKYSLKDTYGWRLSEARRRIRARGDWKNSFQLCLYRPFDIRHIYYHGDLVELPRTECMQHLAIKGNLALLATRQVTSPPFTHALVTRLVSEMKTCSHDRGTNCFPLFLTEDPSTLLRNGGVRPNFAVKFAQEFSGRLQLSTEDFDANAIFSYIYGILYCPGYRNRYVDFLRTEFPRIPLTSDLELFRSVSDLGSSLVALHLLEFCFQEQEIEASNTACYKRIAEFDGADRVVKGLASANNAWESGRVSINRSSGFFQVPEEVWNFRIGGYQVCHKWLKDRKGRELSDEDILHYCKIVTALNETIRIMDEIDEVIEEHGGWPIQ